VTEEQKKSVARLYMLLGEQKCIVVLAYISAIPFISAGVKIDPQTALALGQLMVRQVTGAEHHS
jgi:hypothetical protein